MVIIITFFQIFGKYPILKQPLKSLVNNNSAALGKFFKSILVILSSPGDLRLGRCLIIWATVPGVMYEQ